MYKSNIEPISFAIKTPLSISQLKEFSEKYNMPLQALGDNIWKLKFLEDVWEDHWDMEPYPEGTCTKVLSEAGSLVFMLEEGTVSHFECLDPLLDTKCDIDSLISLMEWEFDIKVRTLTDHLRTIKHATEMMMSSS